MINLARLTAGYAPAGERTDENIAETRVADAVFESLVETHYKRTYNLIYRMVRSEADAADLTQETFVRVYRALPRILRLLQWRCKRVLSGS